MSYLQNILQAFFAVYMPLPKDSSGEWIRLSYKDWVSESWTHFIESKKTIEVLSVLLEVGELYWDFAPLLSQPAELEKPWSDGDTWLRQHSSLDELMLFTQWTSGETFYLDKSHLESTLHQRLLAYYQDQGQEIYSRPEWDKYMGPSGFETWPEVKAQIIKTWTEMGYPLPIMPPDPCTASAQQTTTATTKPMSDTTLCVSPSSVANSDSVNKIYFNSKGEGKADPKYSWLSNFYNCQVRNTFGECCSNVEAAFQSSKFEDPNHRNRIRLQNGATAKKLGAQVHPSFRKDWNEICTEVMNELHKQKYSSNNPKLKDLLLETGDAELIEYAPWDSKWGVNDKLIGQNLCGKSIMSVRYSLQSTFNCIQNSSVSTSTNNTKTMSNQTSAPVSVSPIYSNHMTGLLDMANKSMDSKEIRTLIHQYNQLAESNNMKPIDVVKFLASHVKPWDVLKAAAPRPVFDAARHLDSEGFVKTQWIGELYNYLNNPFSIALMMKMKGQGNFAQMDDMRNQGYKNLAFWVGIVGNPLPKFLLDKIAEGKVYTYLRHKDESLDWTTSGALKAVKAAIAQKRDLRLVGSDMDKAVILGLPVDGKKVRASIGDLNPGLVAELDKYHAIPELSLDQHYEGITVLLPENITKEELLALREVLGDGCGNQFISSIAANAIKEAAPDFKAWLSYLRAMPSTDGYYNVPLTFFGNDSSNTELSVNFDDLKLKVDGTEYNARNWISVNSALVHRGLGLAYFVDYLVRSTSEAVLKGRLAHTLKVTEERTSYGTEHPIATTIRQNKMGNNIVGLMNPDRAQFPYSLQVSEGKKQSFVEIVKYNAEPWCIPHAMSKSASYLLLGKGAQATGVAIVKNDDGEFYTYHTNADKISKLVGGRTFTAINTAMTNALSESLIRIRIEDDIIFYLGDKARAGVFHSPVGNQGSGTIPANVYAMAASRFEEQTTESFSIIAAQGSGEQSYYVRPEGTILNYGDVVAGRVNPCMAADPSFGVGLDQVVTWTHRTPGVIMAPANGEAYGTLNEVTNTWTIKVPVLKYSQGEIAEDGSIVKRGTPQKYRGGLMEKGRTLHIDNFFVYSQAGNGEDILSLKDIQALPVVFDPNADIRQPNNSHLLSRCACREVGKTPRGFVVSAVADQLPEGHAIFDTNSGEWDRWEEIKELAEKNTKMYVLLQIGVEKNFWHSMKARYGDNTKDFMFFEHEGRLCIAHKNVPGIVGTDISIVEVPLTEDFCGWQSKFFDDRLYKNVANGNLSDLLEKESAKMEAYYDHLFSMANNTKVDGRQYVVVDPRYSFLTVGKDSTDLAMQTKLVDGEYVLAGGNLPGYSPSIKFGNQMQKWLKAQSKLVSEQTGTKVDFIGFEFRIGNRSQVVIPQVVSKLSGTVSQNLFRAMVAMVYHYAAMPQVWSAPKNCMVNVPNSKGWDANLNRHIGSFVGALKSMVISSDATMAKITKTIPCFATGRVAGSCSDKVELGKVYLNPVTAEFFGTQSGDRFCMDRVPQPTSVYLEVVVEEWVDPWTFLVSFLDMHAGNEGE